MVQVKWQQQPPDISRLPNANHHYSCYTCPCDFLLTLFPNGRLFLLCKTACVPSEINYVAQGCRLFLYIFSGVLTSIIYHVSSYEIMCGTRRDIMRWRMGLTENKMIWLLRKWKCFFYMITATDICTINRTESGVQVLNSSVSVVTHGGDLI